MDNNWDIIVIGGGHAGCEAAVASAKMGLRTAMITQLPEKIGFMSCNPAMGGLAKGQLIKEIDALGGIMGINTDKTAIQYRRLNSSKGPAVRSSRAQCDKLTYARSMLSYLKEEVLGLSILRGEVEDILTENSRVTGVRLKSGETLSTRAAVVTSGTFLRALMYTGFEKTEGGRVGDPSARGLSIALERMGFRLRRLKTGTPPRLHRKSIDFSKLELQPGDLKPVPFSFYFRPERFPVMPQVPCYITYTNDQTHEIIEQNFDRSPMFTGMIQGVGPRYCPSIEDKVKRFRDKDRHQIFLEPEGLDVDEIYVNGISTSLPVDVQEKFVHSIHGLEAAEFVRHGYAVEYDAVDARQLQATLQAKDIQGLFLAGQVNGTSGYEEAGAQGLIAGINAALFCQEKAPFTLARDEGYIGVLIDDLVLKGSDEPYRMFTSRAEYRLLLREDNADIRLTEKGRQLGLIDDSAYDIFQTKMNAISTLKEEIKSFSVFPTPESRRWFTDREMHAIQDKISGEFLLKRPEIGWTELNSLGLDADQRYSEDVLEQVEIQTKYEGYIKRDVELLQGLKKQEGVKIPFTLDFDEISGLSTEVRMKLKEVRPETLGQASRIQGVTPAAVAGLMIYLKSMEARQKSAKNSG